ncbi:ABC transporter substrate-binding protein [Elioraea sp.]|uniref:ABC transporter substrate-binding protein n=1 Tax=Elioraea sp. TaxID=2185103 RepID=UPI0025B88F84|nr:ABC transporter substrate-binding protein [Elioraea sp.]
MRRSILAAAAAGLMLAAAPGATPAASRDLTIVSWGGAYQDAQRQVYFRPFSQATGVRFVEDNWDGGIGVLRTRMQSGNNTWDLVQVESEELLLGCEEGLFEKLDYSRIGGRDLYLPEAAHECGVGAILYNFVLAWDRTKFQGTPTWADFWNVERFPGKRGLRRGVKMNLEYALLADGVPANQVYATLRTDAGVERAFRMLDRLKPHIVWWQSSAQAPQILGAGEVLMTSSPNGRITNANRTERRDFGIQWAGSLYTIDSWVIMKGSPNTNDAYRFLNFASNPRVQAQLVPLIPYGGASKGANAGLSPELLAASPTNPANLSVSLMIDDQFWLDNLDKLSQRFNAWLAR